MKNRNLSFTLTGRTRLFLFICLGAATIVDFTAFLYLTTEGISPDYWIFPLLFFIADIIFLVQAIFSNYRFKYTIAQIVFYTLFSFVVFLSMLGSYYSGVDVFTSSATAIWVIAHLLSLASAISCYIFTAKLSKKAVTHAVISVIFGGVSAILALSFVATVLAVGFFGQGAYCRPLVYEYNEVTDTYAITGVLEGRSNSVSIPAEFDGKKIDEISYSVFSAPGIEYATLDCDTDVEFYGDKSGISLNAVYVSKEKIDVFKHALYSAEAFSVANAMTPYDVDENEVYATFCYGAEEYGFVGGKIFDTWYGKKGDKLELSYFKDVPFAAHSDKTSDADLYWNYLNNGKTVLSSLEFGGKNIINAPITESVDKVEVVFEKICRLYPNQSNDEKYPASQNFIYSEADGSKLGYKLVPESGVQSYLNSYSREGFSLTTSVTGGDDKNVNFEWKLNAPVVTATSNKTNDRVVYGDSITLSAQATSPAEGITLSYEWRDSATSKSNQQNYTIAQTPYGDETYTVTVTASGENTSLTSTSFAYLSVTVEKRPLTISWTYPHSNVYDGADKEIICAITEPLISGDTVNLTQEKFRYKTVGSYTPSVSLTGASSEKYVIVGGQSQSYTIEKADLAVNWTTTELVYSGEMQSPKFSLLGLQGEDALSDYTLSGGINVGSYDLQLVIKDGFITNYNLTNTAVTLKITQFPLNVVWRTDLAETFVYDGNTHAMQASAAGAGGNSIPLTFSIASIKDAGDYTVTASVSNTNYVIASGGTRTYKITPYGLTAEWIQTTLTYNGKQQIPEYRLTGLAGDGNITGGGTGAEKFVGDNYVCTLSVSNNKNYYVAENATTTYKIVPASVAVQWNVPTMTYNGKMQAPTAFIRGLGDDASISLSCTTTGAIDAGTHLSEATLVHDRAKNYTLTGTTRNFTIDRRLVGVTVENTQMTYGEAVPQTFNYVISQVAEGDKEDEVVTNIKFEIEGYSGGYILPNTYTVRASADVTSNYTFATTVSTGQLTVNRAKLLLKIDNKEINSGDSLPAFTFTVLEGAIVGDDIIISSYQLDREFDGAGEYTISPVWGDISFKYECGIQYGKLTVKEADNGVREV